VTNFTWALDLAKQLIDANGEQVGLKLFQTATPNILFPNEVGVSTFTMLSARAVFLNYKGSEAGFSYKDGTEIQREDKKVLMAAKGLTQPPNLQGSITRANGDLYRIIQVIALDPDGTNIFFEVQVRR